MDQSLDSIIKSKQKEKRSSVRTRPPAAVKKTFKSNGAGGRGSGTASGKFSAPVVAPQKKTVVVLRPTVRAPASIFDRLGTASSAGETGGTKVVISGLTKAVTRDDISQLCSSIGDVKNVSKKFDTAEVLFERRSHALHAVKKFHGLTLDGVPMSVVLAGEGGRSNPFDPNASSEPQGRARGSNVREGLFGTRGADAPSSAPIDFGYKSAKAAGVRGQSVTVTINNRDRDQQGDRDRARANNSRDSSRGGGGRGGNGGRGAKRAPRQPAAARSAQDLDQEMDAYLAAR